MTKESRSDGTNLREEAARWFALMRGPEAPARRAEFEAWLAAEPMHRDAYNRIGETFSLGKALKRAPREGPWSTARPEAARPSASPRAKTVGAVVLTAILAVAVLASTTFVMRMMGNGDRNAPGLHVADRRYLATARGEIRSFTLSDGSRVTLDTASRVRVSLTRDRRDLELIEGRARFAVAHESRPFVVAAAQGSVTAHGTIFDIALDGEKRAVVDLIEGIVEVRDDGNTRREPTRPDAAGGVQLTAGHSLAFGIGQKTPSVRPFVKADWPEGLRDFRSVRLGVLVADANRYASTPIVLASSDLADLRISGTFGVRDTRRLAGNLAGLLDLTVRENDGTIVLARP